MINKSKIIGRGIVICLEKVVINNNNTLFRISRRKSLSKVKMNLKHKWTL